MEGTVAGAFRHGVVDCLVANAAQGFPLDPMLDGDLILVDQRAGRERRSVSVFLARPGRAVHEDRQPEHFVVGEEAHERGLGLQKHDGVTDIGAEALFHRFGFHETAHGFGGRLERAGFALLQGVLIDAAALWLRLVGRVADKLAPLGGREEVLWINHGGPCRGGVGGR